MFPYTCDALLYHWPIATVALIVVNFLTFIAAVEEKIDVSNGWILEYGAGLHPEQWLLSAFMHGSVGHLAGNMVFLWTFGLVTEGKLGWWRFLIVYVGIAVGQSALEQAIVPLIAPGELGSLGASAAIFGLMAMACVWAPINELSVLVILMLRPFVFEVSVGVFAAVYVGLDIVYCFVFGAGALASASHLTGALIGALLGVVLLKLGVVECEDNDLLSVMSGVHGMERQKLREEAAHAEKVVERSADQSLEMRRRFEAYLKIGQPQEALATLQRARHRRIPIDTDRADLLALIGGLQEAKQWAESAPVMAELLERFPAGSEAVRIKLAQVCLIELGKPGKALELINALDGAELKPQLAAARDKVRAVAQRKLGEGELEVDDAAW
ncbi:MAG: rhomboid family intramembrane serine protease [Planctomycetaceae bacterium]|nr:rhomboid family intramembrane serine protease [Planctomycetaceae bacterium]